MFRKILVAVDDSVAAHKALQVASDMAVHYDSSLCLLHAFPHTADYLGSPIYDHMVSAHTLQGQTLLAQLQAEIRADVVVETQLMEGPPAAAILRVAEIEGCDLIVVGSRGHGQLLNLLVGSISNKVAHRAHCPVMIVH